MKFEHSIKRAHFQQILRDQTALVSASPVWPSDPLLQTKVTKVPILARRANHSVCLEIRFENLGAAIWTLLCKLVDPVYAEPAFELLQLFLCEDSNLFAVFELPQRRADEVVFIRKRASNLKMSRTDDRLYQGNQGASANPMSTAHLGDSFLIIDGINSIGVCDD